MRSIRTAVARSAVKRLRIRATAIWVSRSAYAAEPFIPTIPNAEPGRDGLPPGRPGLEPKAQVAGKPMTSSVAVKLAPLGQDMGDRSGNPFAVDPAPEQAAGRHGSPAPRIGEAANRINGQLAVPYDRDLQPRLVSRGDALVDQCLNSHLGAFSTHVAKASPDDRGPCRRVRPRQPSQSGQHV